MPPLCKVKVNAPPDEFSESAPFTVMDAIVTAAVAVTASPPRITTGLQTVGTNPLFHVLVADHTLLITDVIVLHPTGSQRMCCWVASSSVLFAPTSNPVYACCVHCNPTLDPITL